MATLLAYDMLHAAALTKYACVKADTSQRKRLHKCLLILGWLQVLGQ